MCSFHYWGEDKDLGHLTAFPFMNLNESDRIFSEHEMYCIMFQKHWLGDKSKCWNIGISVMTFCRSESGVPFPKKQYKMTEKTQH